MVPPTSPLSGISDDLYTSLIDGLIRGDYHLLLGAGASAKAIGGDGKELPGAETLTSQIVEDFQLNTGGEVISLSRAVANIKTKTDRLNRDKAGYFRSRFSGCKATWQTVFATIRWNTIWSLNIDDVIESAYAQTPASAQRVSSLEWQSRFHEPNRSKNELLCVHLHGLAASPHLPNNLVFSISEYLRAADTKHSWHRIFADQFQTRPFIIIGARLVDEYDLRQILELGNRSLELLGRPSVVVLRTIPPMLKEELQDFGLIAIEASGQDFLQKIAKDYAIQARSYAAALPGGSSTFDSPEASVFLSQFHLLRPNPEVRDPAKHDFYAGDEPVWGDIVQSRDALRDCERKVLGQIQDVQEGRPNQEIVCLFGDPGSGKSTALLRLGLELAKRGRDVFQFRGEEFLDVNAALWWLARAPNTVLLFDDISDFANDVARLANRATEKAASLLLIGADRTTKKSTVLNGMSEDLLPERNQFDVTPLSSSDIDAIISKLSSAHRLGVLTRKSRDERRKYFRTYANRQLLVALADLEGGRGFRARIKDEFENDVPDGLAKQVYGLTCITSALGYPLPTAIVGAVTGESVREVTDVVVKTLQGIVAVDKRGLRARHRLIASMIVESAIAKKELYELTRALAVAISPYVTKETIRAGTLPFRIVRTLMNVDTLWDWLGASEISSWYEAIQPFYEWNSRFWEQRARAELRAHSYLKARSYAEEALHRHEHEFSYNTHGLVLVRMAVDYYEPGSDSSTEAFWNGVRSLRKAQAMSRPTEEHPFMTFFSYALTFAEKAYRTYQYPIPRELVAEWDAWWRDAERSVLIHRTDTAEKLRDLRAKWLRLATT